MQDGGCSLFAAPVPHDTFIKKQQGLDLLTQNHSGFHPCVFSPWFILAPLMTPRVTSICLRNRDPLCFMENKMSDVFPHVQLVAD